MVQSKKQWILPFFISIKNKSVLVQITSPSSYSKPVSRSTFFSLYDEEVFVCRFCKGLVACKEEDEIVNPAIAKAEFLIKSFRVIF